MSSDARPFLIGLTGPIGCGKTTAARMLGELGGTVIDADELARRATEREDTLREIRSRFGDAVLRPNGSLDRGAMAGLAFGDPSALADLERIVHPQVRQLVDDALTQAESERVPFVALEAIKLVEGGLADRCDEVWLVECLPSNQRARLAARGLSEADAAQRIAAQGEGLADRLAAALGGRIKFRRLATDGTLEQTRETVEDTLADALAPLLLD